MLHTMPHLDESSQFVAERFQPLYDRVVIKQRESAAQTASGIVLPDIAKEKYNEGQVIAVGEGYRMADGDIRPLSVEVGDTVLYSKYGGTEISIGDKDYIIISERDIHGIMQDPS